MFLLSSCETEGEIIESDLIGTWEMGQVSVDMKVGPISLKQFLLNLVPIPDAAADALVNELASEFMDIGGGTITFNEDGTVAIQADCNNAGGAFETDGSSLGIEIGPMTLAECAPGSLYNEFIQQLGTADSYVVQADTLTLTLAAGGGSMKLIRV